MNVRVEVDHVGAGVDLEAGAWTPELLETLLRMCSDEVIRICQTLGTDPMLLDDDLMETDVDETPDIQES